MDEYICDRCNQAFDYDRYLAHKSRKVPCSSVKPPVVNNNITLNEDLLSSDNPLIDQYLNTPLPPFDINSLLKPAEKDNFSMILTASRRSGKTTLLSYLYPLWQQHFDIVVTFSYSIHNKTYNFVQEPKFDNYYPDALKDIFKLQRKTSNRLKILIIFDDLVSSKVKDDDDILQAYIRGRNSNISIVISTQILTLISRKNRGNSDFIFIGKTNSSENRLTLIESLLMNAVKTPETIRNKTQKLQFLDKWLMNHTEDYNFIVMDCYNDKESLFNFKVNK